MEFAEKQFLALPDPGQRIELIDGTLLVRPLANGLHQRMVTRMTGLLDQAAPPAFEALHRINVRLAPGRIVIPDIAVLTRAGVDDLVAEAAEVVMFAEIVSPSTRQVDRLLKPGLAAQAGIPFYVLVEPDGPTVTVFELSDGVYREVAAASGDERISVTEPFPVDFRPAELLASRRS